ncbi:MAG: hypothetical protein Q8P44_07265, partial [Dehalococcoidia bacterium]|nr:hypothetical protein [Dehalococcoidia bacterium]
MFKIYVSSTMGKADKFNTGGTTEKKGKLIVLGLMAVAAVMVLSACGSAEPAVLVVVTPKAAKTPNAPQSQKDAAAQYADILKIFENSLSARGGGTPAARVLIDEIKASLKGSNLGGGIWELTGRGRWLVKPAGRSVQPVDEEARKIMDDLVAFRPTPTPVPPTETPTPIPSPVPTPSPTTTATP